MTTGSTEVCVRVRAAVRCPRCHAEVVLDVTSLCCRTCGWRPEVSAQDLALLWGLLLPPRQVDAGALARLDARFEGGTAWRSSIRVECSVGSLGCTGCGSK